MSSWPPHWCRIPAFWVLWCLGSCLISLQASLFGKRELPQLSSDELTVLVSGVPDPVSKLDPANSASHLSKILIPRAPGTENITLARNYIVSTLKKLDWEIEEDEFTDDTPVGKKKFTNIIATKDPSAPRRLILSAHYDSKYYPNYPENQFLGATDSAAPCAMMLDIAETLDPLLDDRHKRWEEGLMDDDDESIADITLQLVFFDGEEAFHDWTDTDSIYGARHLARKWANTYRSTLTRRRLLGSQETEISSIEHLILLDLLGAPDPLIRSYYADSAWMFDALVAIEERLGDSGAFEYGEDKLMASGSWRSWFVRRNVLGAFGHIGDDHVPFLKEGVSVLHIISEPFPRVWHTLKDDASALDLPTMRRWSLLLRIFLSEYLHLKPNIPYKRDDLHELDSQPLSNVGHNLYEKNISDL